MRNHMTVKPKIPFSSLCRNSLLTHVLDQDSGTRSPEIKPCLHGHVRLDGPLNRAAHPYSPSRPTAGGADSAHQNQGQDLALPVKGPCLLEMANTWAESKWTSDRPRRDL